MIIAARCLGPIEAWIFLTTSAGNDESQNRSRNTWEELVGAQCQLNCSLKFFAQLASRQLWMNNAPTSQIASLILGFYPSGDSNETKQLVGAFHCSCKFHFHCSLSLPDIMRPTQALSLRFVLRLTLLYRLLVLIDRLGSRRHGDSAEPQCVATRRVRLQLHGSAKYTVFTVKQPVLVVVVKTVI